MSTPLNGPENLLGSLQRHAWVGTDWMHRIVNPPLFIGGADPGPLSYPVPQQLGGIEDPINYQYLIDYVVTKQVLLRVGWFTGLPVADFEYLLQAVCNNYGVPFSYGGVIFNPTPPTKK